MQTKAPRVAVIIPFFQRVSGIVQRTVDAALRQSYRDFEIIVVDDCSPISALSELGRFLERHPDQIQIVEMPKNSGQGAARNKGLDNVRPGTEYVAFLDSDDEWTEDHLSNAVNALDAGHDFYFSDFYQLAQTVSAFTRAKRINPSNHRALAGQTNLHVFESDMFSQIIVGNVLGMSTIVYRVSCAPDLRFREDFRSCGEEYLFWCSLSKRTSRIAFSSNIECTYGPGVNTFSGATFGRDGAIRRVHDEIRYLKAIRLEYACTPQQSRHLRRRIHTMRTDFVRELLHRLARGRSLEPKLCWSIVKMDPLCVPLSAPIAARVALDAAKSQIMGSRARNGP